MRNKSERASQRPYTKKKSASDCPTNSNGTRQGLGRSHVQEVRPSTKIHHHRVRKKCPKTMGRKNNTEGGGGERKRHEQERNQRLLSVGKPPLATITFQACSGYPAHPRRTLAECVGSAAASKFHRHLRQAVHGDHGRAVAAPHINCSTRHVAPCTDRTIAETQTIVFKRRENTTRNHEPTRTHART